jgi:hypothetical protein
MSVSGADQNATVTLHAVDPYGKSLGLIEVIRFVKGETPKGRNYSSSFHEGKAQDIPYGDYDVAVAVGGMRISEKVEVLTSETFIVLTSSHYMEYMSGPGPTLIGQVTGLPGGGKVQNG